MCVSKKVLEFLKVGTGSKIAVKCVSNGFVSWKVLFRPKHDVLLAKSQKSGNVEKIRNFDE